MTIRSDRVIWYTRGGLWGFRFLSFGNIEPSCADELHMKVFASEERAAVSAGEWFGFAEGLGYYFVAARVYDEIETRDEVGRRIPHELICLGCKAEIDRLIGRDWAQDFLNGLREFYQQHYLDERINEALYAPIIELEVGDDACTSIPIVDIGNVFVDGGMVSNNGTGKDVCKNLQSLWAAIVQFVKMWFRAR